MIENNRILPDNTTVVIPSNSYNFLGILSSKFHVEWTKHNSSSLGETNRYTNTTCFETFPFPQKTENSMISSLMQKIEFYRRETCKTRQYGLTTLYTQMLEGKQPILKELHTQLDQAVAELYHFPTKNLSSKKEILKHLIKLNREFYEAFHRNSVS